MEIGQTDILSCECGSLMNIVYFGISVRDPPITEPPLEPECRQDPDCPAEHACLNALCKNPCSVTSPCLPSQECRVVEGVPLRTMVCECPPDQILVKDGICIKPGI